jgi:uncharacterized protein YcfJ
MKRRSGFWLLWALALVSITGCGMAQKKRNYMVAGAIAGGAVGAGIGSAAEGDDTRTTVLKECRAVRVILHVSRSGLSCHHGES